MNAVTAASAFSVVCQNVEVLQLARRCLEWRGISPAQQGLAGLPVRDPLEGPNFC